MKLQVRHREPEYSYPWPDNDILIYLPLIDNEPLVGHHRQRLKIQDHLRNNPLVGSQGSRIILRPVAWRRRSIGKHLREKRLLKFKNHENHLILKRLLAGFWSQINESHLRIFHLTVRPLLLLLGCLRILFCISLRSVFKPETLVVAGQMIGDSSDI